jgi:homoserine dehydrogenase
MSNVPLKIGLGGVGTVGAALVRLLHDGQQDFAARTGRRPEIVAFSARSPGDRGLPLGGANYYADAVELAGSADIDVFVELIGGAQGPALAAVEAALTRRVPVVTANKAMLAAHGVALAERAELGHVALAFEAAVAGGVPIVKTLREALAGNRIQRVSGILNGTCNYILSRMEIERLPFEICLKEAQRLGYAEADPTFDIGGFDTAHKLSILAAIAFGARVDASAVSVEGIESLNLADLTLADELGYRIKLLGVAARTAHGVEQRVHPTMLPKSSALAQTMGVLNAVSVDGDAVGSLTLVGPGAGGSATASAVASDLADIARGLVVPAFGRPVAALVESERASLQRHEGGYYVRLSAVDKPGSLASIAGRMAERGVSLESVMQKPADGGDASHASLAVITHATTETSIREALALTVQDGVVRGKPQVIRIERP